jgi:putative NIF3 family GTP cyclohydrolase 1 type 2
MFIKVTRSGGHSYAQLVESFRNEEGKPRQRTVATIGRVDDTGGAVDLLLKGLLRAKGMPASMADAPQVAFESALALGDVWALDQLWKEIGFDRLAGVFRKARYTTPIEHAVRVMVFNRLCDPDSKLGVLRWLETVSLPEVDTSSLTHQHLLRSMDALMDHQSAVDVVVAQLLRPLIDQDLSLVFYDLTTIRAAGLSVLEDDVRHYGMAKEGIIARQFMLGVVQTAEGLPIYHEVFDGNQGESPTLMPTLQKVLTRFAHIKRLIVVADRGLLSLDNMDELGKVKLPSGQALEFILAVPGRRYGEFVQTLQDFQRKVADAKEEVIDETTWKTSRLVIAHNPVQALEQTTLRRQRLQAWRTRPLDETPYVILDARYERVRHANQVVDCAVLVAIGITGTGHRRVLGVSVALSEAEVHWRAFLDSLIQRGLRGVKYIASDDHAGLKAARKAMFPGVTWQRCQFHLQHNAQGYVSKLDRRTPVARQIRAIFNAGDAHEAQRLLNLALKDWQVSHPQLAAWAETKNYRVAGQSATMGRQTRWAGCRRYRPRQEALGQWCQGASVPRGE